MNNTKHIPATQNESWGFYGTMNEQGRAAWPLAMAAVSDATGHPLESVRIFLDSRYCRHFADDERPFAVKRFTAAASPFQVPRVTVEVTARCPGCTRK